MTNKKSGTAAILTEVEKTWAAIQRKHPDVPDVAIALATGREGHAMKYGHFAAETWRDTAKDSRTHELFIGAEPLAAGGQVLLNTLLHEAAHALAHARGLKDTSRQGRYHNKVFASVAKDLGLTPPDQPNALGFSDCTLSDGTVGKYTTQIARLDAVLSLYRISRADLGAEKEPSEKPAAVHECASSLETVRLAISRKAWDQTGGLLCPTCLDNHGQDVASFHWVDPRESATTDEDEDQ